MFAEHPFCSEFTDFALALASEARRILAGRTGEGLFDAKSDASPVTEFDRRVETRLREMIRERYPAHGILGEEFPDENVGTEFVWVMDPIDGTKAFVAGIPVFTTLIALCLDGVPVIGVIDAPSTGDSWVGVQGKQTTRNGTAIRTSGRIAPDGSIVAFPNPEVVRESHETGVELLKERSSFRIYGGSSYSFGQVAAGAIDVTIESDGLDFYDVCALVPVIEGAGGVCTDAFGERLTMQGAAHSCIAAATPRLHEEVVQLLGGA